MTKKSAALEAKFEIAVKTLLKAPNLTVQEAMLVAKFSTKDIENKSMQKIIARCIPGGKRAMAALLPPASAWTPNFMNSARLHKVFQNFVVPWKIHIYINLILSSDASRRDTSNGIRVAYVNFYHKWVLRHG